MSRRGTSDHDPDDSGRRHQCARGQDDRSLPRERVLGSARGRRLRGFADLASGRRTRGGNGRLQNRLLGLVAQLLNQLGDGPRGCGAELALHQLRVLPSHPERLRSLARGGEGVHPSEGGFGAERVELGEAAPPVRGRPVVATPARIRGEFLERGAGAARQALPFGFNPTLELLTPVEIVAVEEWPGVLGNCSAALALLERALESAYVARDGGGVQLEDLPAPEQLGVAQLPAEVVASLLEEMPAARGV